MSNSILGNAYVRIRPDTAGFESSARSGLAGAMANIGKIAGAALAVALGSAVADSMRSNSKLAAQLGLSPEETKRAGKVAGEVYSQNFGESLAGVNDAVRAVVTGIGTDLNSADLSTITKKALLLKDTFGQDLASATEAVGALMRSGLAKDATEAFDVITAGFQRGADRSGDFMDTLREYGAQFQKFGLDAKTATGLLTQGMQAGARNSDLVADAIKEFSIRAVDGSKLTGESFAALGLNAQKMAHDIASGGETSSQAMALTLDRLRAVEDPALQAQLAVGLFGTQAEDLGAALYALDPNTAVAALGDVAGAADAAANSVHGNVISMLETWVRTARVKLTEIATVVAEQLPNLFAAFADGDAQGVGEVLDHIFGNTGEKVAFFRSTAEQLIPVINQVRAIFANLWGIAVQLAPVIGVALGGAARLVWEVFKLLLPVLTQITGFLAEHQGVVIALAAGYGVLRAAMAAHSAALAAQTAGGALAWLKNWVGQMKIAQAVQKAWTAIQWLFNAAMNANPIVRIVGLVALLVGALIAAYQNSETFRSIVQGAFEAIGAAASWVWTNVLQPVWTALTAAWDALATGIQWAWENILKPVFDVLGTVAQALGIFLMVVVFGPLMLAWKALTLAIEWAWDNILKPVWDAISVAAQWLWNNALQPVFAAIGWYWDALLLGLKIAWETVLKPAWDALVAAARWLWDNVLLPIFTAIGWYWNALLVGIQWAWQNILKPAWDAISTAAGWLWNNILKPIFDAIGAAWTGLFNGMKWAWDNILKPVFDFFGNAVTTIKDGFTTAVDWIGKVWESLKEKLMAPVQWTVDFVWNNGLRKLWNFINNLWGGDDMAEFKLATGGVLPQQLGGPNGAFATGGVLPGYTPGRDVHRFISPTGGILNLSGGEAVMRPEFTRAMGVHGVNALNAAARTGGVQGVANALAAQSAYEQSHKDGGIIGVPDWLTATLDVIPGGGLVSDVINQINGGTGWGGGQWAEGLKGTVKQTGSKIWEKVKAMFDVSGGGFGASNPSPNGVGGLGPMARAARDFVMRTWGITNIGGYANRNIAGTGQKSDHALGKAIDVMIPNYKSATGIGLGNQIAGWFVNNPAAFGTKYVIWRDRINSGRGWEPYGHPGGGRNDTLQHRDHVHVSVYDDGGVLEPGLTPVLNKSGKPEAVFTNDEWQIFKAIAAGGGAAPLVGGDLILQAGEGASVGDQMDEAVFELRRIKRGGVFR